MQSDKSAFLIVHATVTAMDWQFGSLNLVRVALKKMSNSPLISVLFGGKVGAFLSTKKAISMAIPGHFVHSYEKPYVNIPIIVNFYILGL